MARSEIVPGLEIDFDKNQVFVQGNQLPFSVLEFRLLFFMVRNVDKVLSREMVLDAVWRGGASLVSDRVVDRHIYNLRNALGPLKNHVESVYGGGYRFTTKPKLKTDYVCPKCKRPWKEIWK